MVGTRLILVRHGESMAQEGSFLGGHDGCTGLSARGRQQAERLRDRLAASGELAGTTAVYASLLPRAIETAEILAPALGDGALPLVTDCGFCEGHPGEADGLTFAALAELTGGAEWTDDLKPVPGWETWSEMQARVSATLDDVLARHEGETVVVACHGGVIVHSMLHWLSLDEVATSSRAWISPINTSLTEWRASPNPYRTGTLPLELVRFNDHAHLAGTDLLSTAL